VSGGSVGVRDIGLVESAVHRPKVTFDAVELYETAFDKAAALFHSIIFNHAFLDGNKRTVVASASQILYINGFELLTSNEELENFTLDIVVGGLDIEEISAWLEKYAKKVK